MGREEREREDDGKILEAFFFSGGGGSMKIWGMFQEGTLES